MGGRLTSPGRGQRGRRESRRAGAIGGMDPGLFGRNSTPQGMARMSTDQDRLALRKSPGSEHPSPRSEGPVRSLRPACGRGGRFRSRGLRFRNDSALVEVLPRLDRCRGPATLWTYASDPSNPLPGAARRWWNHCARREFAARFVFGTSHSTYRRRHSESGSWQTMAVCRSHEQFWGFAFEHPQVFFLHSSMVERSAVNR